MLRVRGMLLIVCASLALFLFGCAKPTPVGKWSGNYQVMNMSLATTLEFKTDGTMTQTTKTPVGETSGVGTYRVEDDKLALHLTKITLASREIPVPAKMSDQSAAFKLEGDKLTLTRDGKAMEFTRVKG